MIYEIRLIKIWDGGWDMIKIWDGRWDMIKMLMRFIISFQLPRDEKI